MSKIIELASKSVSKYIKHGEKLSAPENLDEKLTDKQKAVFVTIKKDGDLRGCIGTIKPTEESVAEEIISNAISACKDPRFSPITKKELPKLSYEVNLLTEPELILEAQGIPQDIPIDPKKEGVLVKSRKKTGLLLPNLEGIDSAKEQLKHALKKGGIGIDEEFKIYKFETNEYKGV